MAFSKLPNFISAQDWFSGSSDLISLDYSQEKYLISLDYSQEK